MKLFIGLMSGTSMDGIDAALMDLSSNTLVAGATYPYSDKAKQFLSDVLEHPLINFRTYSQLNTLLGKEFAQAALNIIDKSRVPSSEIRAIGSHGQTLFHDATTEAPYTVQMGCAHTIAHLTGITVVADFRTRDLIAGGQGAPFAPIYHQALFKDLDNPLAIVNIGGIANITCLTNQTAVLGYDIGPGNCLMDSWIQKHLGHAYDKQGAWASSGQIIGPLLNSLLADPYFKREQPKSIGKEYFSLQWLENHVRTDYVNVDVQATLMTLTASTIATSFKSLSPQPDQLLLCGGGAHNQALMRCLATLLPTIKVQSTSALHIDPDFIEASMIAWLAEKALAHTALDLREITGSTRPVVLGTIYPA